MALAPSVAAGMVAGLVDYAVLRGADRALLLERSGLVAAELDDPDRRLPVLRYLDLIAGARELTGDPALALHYGRDVAMADISILGLIMEASATMAEALTQLQRYGRLALDSDAGPRLALAQEAGRLHLVDVGAGGFPDLIEMALVQLTCGPRRFLPQPHVLAVELQRPAPAHADAYRAVFGCPVQFGAARNGIELHPGVALWPVAQNSRYVFGLLAERAEALLRGQTAERSMRGRLEALLQPELRRGPVSMDQAAARLGLSRTTLFRRLRDEGTSFAAVLEELRRRLAMQYLRVRRSSVNETAYLLGFSDPAAFSRAFRRWTGMAPGTYRGRSAE